MTYLTSALLEYFCSITETQKAIFEEGKFLREGRDFLGGDFLMEITLTQFPYFVIYQAIMGLLIILASTLVVFQVRSLHKSTYEFCVPLPGFEYAIFAALIPLFLCVCVEFFQLICAFVAYFYVPASTSCIKCGHVNADSQ